METPWLTPNLKLRLAVNLSCDLGRQRNLEFDGNIFLPRSRWVTLYCSCPADNASQTSIALKEQIRRNVTTQLVTLYCAIGDESGRR